MGELIWVPKGMERKAPKIRKKPVYVDLAKLPRELPVVCGYYEMCEILRLNPNTARACWRSWPHFFPTKGRSARTVLFEPARVIRFLIEMTGENYGYRAIQDQGGPQIQGYALYERSTRYVGNPPGKEWF